MKPDLPALVAAWQAKLRLQDWRISVAYVADLTNPAGAPVWGLCYPLLDQKEAKIFVRDPEASKTISSNPPTVETVVVHELTHLHFAPLSGTSKAEVAAEENAVWALSSALVRAKGTRDEPVIMRAMLAQVAPRRMGGSGMDPKIISGAIDAIEAGDAAKALAILKALIVSAAGGAAPAEGDGSGAPAEAKPPAGPPPSGGGAPGAPGAPGEKKDEPAAAKAPMCAAVDPVIAQMAVQVQELTNDKRARDKVTLDGERAELAARPGLAAGLRAMIAKDTTSIETAREIANAAAPVAARSARSMTTEVIAGALTQGEGQAAAVSQLPPEQAAQLHRAMGIIPAGENLARTNEAGQFIRPIETPTQARARMAAAQKGQA